jgi:hypothetical protein
VARRGDEDSASCTARSRNDATVVLKRPVSDHRAPCW